MARTYRSTPQPYFSAKSEVAEKNGSGKEIKEVIANPTLTGEEPDLEGLQVGKEKYKAPEGGSDVIVNPTLEGDEEDINGLEVGGVRYKNPPQVQADWNQTDSEAKDFIKNKPNIPDAVVANPTIPSGTTPTPLQNLKVGNNFYSAPEGGGAKVVVITNSTGTATGDVVLTQEQQEDLFELVQGNTFAKDAVINYVWNYGSVGSANYLNIELTLTDKYNKTWISGVFGGTPNYIYQASYYFDGNNVCLSISKVNVNEYCVKKSTNYDTKDYVPGDTIQFTAYEYNLMMNYGVPFGQCYIDYIRNIYYLSNYSNTKFLLGEKEYQIITPGGYVKLLIYDPEATFDANQTYYKYSGGTYAVIDVPSSRVFRTLKNSLYILDPNYTSPNVENIQIYRLKITINESTYLGTVSKYYPLIQPTVANPYIPSGTTTEDLETVKIGDGYYNIPQGGTGEVVESTDTIRTKYERNTWIPYENLLEGYFEGPIELSGLFIWTDGDNIYYSEGGKQLVLDKDTHVWYPKVWSGIEHPEDLLSDSIWTAPDGTVYYSVGSEDGSSYNLGNFMLNKETGVWEPYQWLYEVEEGVTDEFIFSAKYVWTDGTNIYYSYDSTHKVLVFDENYGLLWKDKVWTGLTVFAGNGIWTDGDNIYFSGSHNQYVLDKSTSTWTAKTWNGLDSFSPEFMWTDGDSIYCTIYDNYVSTSYILNKSTSTWSEITFKGLEYCSNPVSLGGFVWTDGENTYYNWDNDSYILNKPKVAINVTPLVNSNIPSKIDKPSQPFTFTELEFSQQKLNIEVGSATLNLWNLWRIMEKDPLLDVLDESFSTMSTVIDPNLPGDVFITIFPKAISSEEVMPGMIRIGARHQSGSNYDLFINDWTMGASSGVTNIWVEYNFEIPDARDLDSFLQMIAREVDNTKETQPIILDLPTIFNFESYGSDKFMNYIVIYREAIDDYEIVRVKDVDKLIKSFIIDGNSGTSSSSSSEE